MTASHDNSVSRACFCEHRQETVLVRPIAMKMFAATAERSHQSKVQYLFSHSSVKVLLGPLQAHRQRHLDDANIQCSHFIVSKPSCSHIPNANNGVRMQAQSLSIALSQTGLQGEADQHDMQEMLGKAMQQQEELLQIIQRQS